MRSTLSTLSMWSNNRDSGRELLPLLCSLLRCFRSNSAIKSLAILMISCGLLLLWLLSIYYSLLTPSNSLYSSSTCSLLTNSSFREVINRSGGCLRYLMKSMGFISLISNYCSSRILLRRSERTPVTRKFGSPVIETPISIERRHRLE